MRRWAGIDEAGYGPNLGPLVMTAVIAEDPSENSTDRGCPDLWNDLSQKATRAGGDQALMWLDDSKKVYRGVEGRARLEAACALATEATGYPAAQSILQLLRALGAGDLADCELQNWLPRGTEDRPWPRKESEELIARLRPLNPFQPETTQWRIVRVQTVVMGPERFNLSLARTGLKSQTHFEAFSQLLRPIWDQTVEGEQTSLACDKHGGRHFYLEPLRQVFHDEWIERGPEGPALSHYVVRQGNRTLDLNFAPRSDADNGLVALASLVSKAVREIWMDAFNAFWQSRIPSLRATAGYPSDALRFRRQIDSAASEFGLEPRLWWREK